MKESMLFLLMSFTLAQQEPGINLLANQSGLPLVTYCELVNNPEQFDGKVVRVQATYYRSSQHGGYLMNRACDEDDKHANLRLSCNDEDSCNALRKTLSHNMQDFFQGEMILIGRFGSAGDYGKLVYYHEGLKFQLEVEKIERDFLTPKNWRLPPAGFRAGWGMISFR